jgi:hypothetical protein
MESVPLSSLWAVEPGLLRFVALSAQLSFRGKRARMC